MMEASIAVHPLKLIGGIVGFFVFFFVLMYGFAVWADKRARVNAGAKAEAKRLLAVHKEQRRRALAARSE